MNTIIVSGRLTANPELATTQSGVERCKFSIAIPRPKRGGQEQPPVYIDCVAWRQLATFISQWFSKGKPIEVVGSLQIDPYTDREGQARKSTYIQVEHAGFVLKDSTDSPQGGGQGAPAAQPRTNGTTSIAPADVLYDEPLPF